MKNTNWNDPNFQGFGRQPRPKKERHAVGTPVGRTLLNIAVTLVFAAVYFYIVLPPISLKSEDFYVFVLLVCAVYGGCAILTSGFQGTGAKGYFTFLKKQCTVPLIAAAALIATALVGAVIGWQLFRAGDYRDLLTVTDGDFAAEVEEISYDQIPCWMPTPPQSWATASWASWRTWSPSSRWPMTTPRSTTRAALSASRPCATAISSSG